MPPPSTNARSTALAAGASAISIATLLGTLYYLDIPSLLSDRVKTRKVGKRCYTTDSSSPPSLLAFKTLTQQVTLPTTYPLAVKVEKNIPIYDCSALDLTDGDVVEALKDEWHHILLSGPGVYVLKNFFTDLELIDRVNTAYDSIIEREVRENGAKGDHFAPASANSRIWNSFSKHGLQDPESFVEYFSNPLFQHVCDAYLGPAYRITSQVNVVKPGGKAQVSHRDYHLGFQTTDDVARWPKAMHTASQLLTLQGAVAHTDMPLDSGPTRLLPFSQMFEEGFMAYRNAEFNEHFLANYVSLPLSKGDSIFFSPALFHAAGENRTKDFNRSANLIQVSSAFGKTMETIDTVPLVEATWDVLVEKHTAEGWSNGVDSFVKAVADGYPFPTSLDRRPPAPGGMAPESEQDLLRKGLQERWDRQRMVEELRHMKSESQA